MLSDWLANLQLLAGRAGRAGRAQPWWDASATTGEGGSACGVAAMGVPLLGSDHPARVHPGFKRYLDDLLVPPLRPTLTRSPSPSTPSPSPSPQAQTATTQHTAEPAAPPPPRPSRHSQAQSPRAQLHAPVHPRAGAAPALRVRRAP